MMCGWLRRKPTNLAWGINSPLGHELEIEHRDKRIFAVNGSPADCIVTGMTHLLKDQKADLVLSGVNRGQNIADLVNCSGTAAGAREGALQGALALRSAKAWTFPTSI